MLHRHLNHERHTLAALDDLIAPGQEAGLGSAPHNVVGRSVFRRIGRQDWVSLGEQVRLFMHGCAFSLAVRGCAVPALLMHRVRGTKLTPSEQRQRESARRKEPVFWSEWLAIMAVISGVAGGALWLGIRVFTWATASPTARMMASNWRL